jgi:hypothetical protein
MKRVQVLVSEQEKEAFREMAEREGVSLSAWLRKAGLERLAESEQRDRLDSPEKLRAFFAACDERESGAEPDWDDHKRMIEASKRSGASDT